ncbi:hypothetical protein Lal_00007594 [Lupinus albus]|uniref:Uncharacterized protein n=1 Tax=Lupinus albus TaxID=3870 RepID=A0A6A4PCW9_LUPAL|nr:hypothetical protein Lalb_Chr16g0383841 [Lupinus albus]KAF1874978.1 hypothetical protein Lal_00007594 [Lupinus albus]
MAPLLLLFFLITSFTVFAEELHTLSSTSSFPHHPTHYLLKPPHHHHHPPASAPAPPPSSPKVHHVPRTFVSVQGVVYVKPCKYAGKDTLLGATPLLGAIVKFHCYSTKSKLVKTAKTDKNGYFFLEAPKNITNFGAHKCNVVLVSASTGLKPYNFNGGVTGSTLTLERAYMSPKGPFTLYNVGPFAFEPKCKH